MQYPFYQRLTKINHMVHVGDMNIPDNMTEWHVPVPLSLKMAYSFDTEPFTTVIVYKRIRTEVGDLFVADVDCLIESS